MQEIMHEIMHDFISFYFYYFIKLKIGLSIIINIYQYNSFSSIFVVMAKNINGEKWTYHINPNYLVIIYTDKPLDEYIIQIIGSVPRILFYREFNQNIEKLPWVRSTPWMSRRLTM